jgi:hypothetical protein
MHLAGATPQAAALEERGQLTNALAGKLLAAFPVDLGPLPQGGAARCYRLQLSNIGHLPATWQLLDYDDPQVCAQARCMRICRLPFHARTYC